MQVRKAYKKSALQLHPDKALAQCRFSVRLGDQGLELCSRSEVGLCTLLIQTPPPCAPLWVLTVPCLTAVPHISCHLGGAVLKPSLPSLLAKRQYLSEP